LNLKGWGKIAMARKAYMLLFLTFLTGGCAESHIQRAQRLEPMLAQAGFRMVPADTPARSQKLSDMTPLKMNYLSRNGKLSYWFADPYVCHCLYAGSERNYAQFEQLEQISQEEQAAQEAANQAEQTKYQEFMNSPAGGTFYGQ
jgi:hypothetical protein